MNNYFLVLELLLYVFTFYLMAYKTELSILYLPCLFFLFAVITTILPVGVFYALVALLIFNIFNKRSNLISQNPAAVLLIIYFLILLTAAHSDLKYSLVFSVIIFFISIPLINLIYKYHSYDVIFSELVKSSLVILVVFVSNVIFSTIANYNPESMYGIMSGVLYGNLGQTDFNVIGVALFIVLIELLRKNNLIVLAIYIIALAFVMLTLRRSAMLVSGLGVLFAFLTMMTQRNIGRLMLYIIVALLIGGVVYLKSDFAHIFNERYEMRRLDERAFEEEKRFEEYEMLYKDMFVLKKYSPWFGYGLFNSEGNYGGGKFEDRTLHGDLTSIAHSSGLIGVFLYLFMIATAFYLAARRSNTLKQKIIFTFCFITFTIFTITGRYTQTDAMVMLFLVSNMALARQESEVTSMEYDEILMQKGVLQ